MFVQSAGSSESLDRYKITRSLTFRSSNSCNLFHTLITNPVVGGDVSTAYNLTIPTDTTNYVLYDQVKAAGWNGYSLCTINLSINAGVKVISTRTGAPALDIRGFPPGVVITVTVAPTAIILGQGGKGGEEIGRAHV